MGPFDPTEKTNNVIRIETSHDTTKRVFGVSDQARHKPACAATEAS